MAKKAKAPRARRSCGTMAAHMRLLERFPAFRQRQFELEMATTARRAGAARVPRLVTVDVVVNVVYQASSQNVSDSQIKSQIAVLNRDFAARQPRPGEGPGPLAGAGDRLAPRFDSPKVVRKKTTRSSFSTDDGVKRASGGGVSLPFEPKTHLNLWVCNLADGSSATTQFPGGPARTDGVVILYKRLRYDRSRPCPSPVRQRAERRRMRSATG